MMKKRTFLTMIATSGATWLLAKANSQALRDTSTVTDSVKNAISDIKPQDYTGLVHKSLEIFTFTTPAMTYHISDLSNLLDEIAKEQGITTPFYDLETCVRGVLSPKGQYGHLGHLDYQLNIVGRCDGYDYTKKITATPTASFIEQPSDKLDKAGISDLEKSLNVGAKS